MDAATLLEPREVRLREKIDRLIDENDTLRQRGSDERRKMRAEIRTLQADVDRLTRLVAKLRTDPYAEAS
jgi:class 3 adenylate cyclase